MYADPDVFFAVGVVFGALSFPALLHSFTHGSGIGSAMGMFAVAATCVTVASLQKPNGYTVEDAPRVVMDVVGRYAR